MTNNGLTKYLNKIFKPKKVSTTLLRKLYLSEKYPVIHNRKDMKQVTITSDIMEDLNILGNDDNSLQ